MSWATIAPWSPPPNRLAMLDASGAATALWNELNAGPDKARISTSQAANSPARPLAARIASIAPGRSASFAAMPQAARRRAAAAQAAAANRTAPTITSAA